MGPVVYFLREVLINLRRSPLMTLSAITTVMVLQLILGSFALLWLNLDNWTQAFTQQVQVVAFLDDEISPEALEKLQKKIQTVGHVAGSASSIATPPSNNCRKRHEGQDFAVGRRRKSTARPL